MQHAYRSAYEHIVSTRLAEARESREWIAPLMPELSAITRARIARSLGGVTGIAGAVAVIGAAVLTNDGSALEALIGAGIAAVFATGAARLLLRGAGAFTTPAEQPIAFTGELTTDLARIDASQPLAHVRRRLGVLEAWSVALPLVTFSLLAPLTLHWIVAGVFSNDSAKSFSEWIRISLIVVGHAHLALAAMSIVYAQKLARASDEELAKMSVHREWAKALGVTVVVSAVPGALLVLIPPLLVTITGLAFVPAMFILMHRRVVAERAALAVTTAAARRFLPAGPA